MRGSYFLGFKMTFSLTQRLALLGRSLIGCAVAVGVAVMATAAHAQCEFRTLSQTEWDRANLALLTSVMRTAKRADRAPASTRSIPRPPCGTFCQRTAAPKVLDRTTSNPARNKNNSLAGNLLALKLNIVRDPSLGDAVVDATLPTFDHDQCIDTPEVLRYPLLASSLGSRNGRITVNEVAAACADTVADAADGRRS
jgi:hypothetical protein